jgi:hypothetical protein
VSHLKAYLDSLRSPSSGVRSMSRALLLALLCGQAWSITQQCVWSDGSTADEFVPCDSSATSGSCCKSEEACLTSGLCYGVTGLLYRGACVNSLNSSKRLTVGDNGMILLTS